MNFVGIYFKTGNFTSANAITHGNHLHQDQYEDQDWDGSNK